MKDLKKSDIWIIAISCFVLFSALFIFMFINREKQRTKCLNNPPEINYIEEDLEDVFLTKNVEVLQEIRDCSAMLYVVKANGLYYKVEYAIVVSNAFWCKWEYKRYIEIKWEE